MATLLSAVHPGQNAWRRLASFTGYGSSVLVLQTSRFCLNMVGARLAGPSEWGLWTLLGTVLAYSYVADFGVVNGMNRDIALFRGRGDHAQVTKIAGTSGSLVLCTSILCGLAAAAYAFTKRDSRGRATLLIFALLLLFYKLFNFAQVYSMAHDNFTRVTRVNFCLAAVTTLCLPLVFAGALRGFLWAQVLGFTVGCYLYLAAPATPFRWGLDRVELVRLAAVGLPIAAVGLVAIFISSIDRWMVAVFLGVRSVGHYSLVVMVGSIVSLVPQTIATRVYPQLAEAWGRTGDLRVVDLLLKESTWTAVGLTLPVVLAMETVVPPMVARFLPAYTEGIPAIRIAALGFIFQAAGCCYSNLFNVVGKQQYSLAVQGLAAISTAGAAAGLLAAGWGLEGAALGATLGSGVYCGGLIAAASRLRIRA